MRNWWGFIASRGWVGMGLAAQVAARATTWLGRLCERLGRQLLAAAPRLEAAGRRAQARAQQGTPALSEPGATAPVASASDIDQPPEHAPVVTPATTETVPPATEAVLPPPVLAQGSPLPPPLPPSARRAKLPPPRRDDDGWRAAVQAAKRVTATQAAVSEDPKPQ
jgi:hypothetical protein